jgi:tripartite-type tricarboxylate transporter receptor subunit TctC
MNGLARSALITFAAAALAPLCAFPQDYPAKPVRMVTQFTAGSGGDALTRVVAAALSDVMKQPVVIENRAGAGGVQAAEAIANAGSNGYTIGALTPGVVVIRPMAGTSFSIDPVRQLEPLTAVGTTGSLIVAHPSVPFNSFREMIEYAKRNPGKLSYATSGVGSPHHMAGEEIQLLTGAQIVHVPYKAGAQAMVDVVAGVIPIGYMIVSEVIPQARAGKLKVLASREAQRLRQFPDVPTVTEILPGFEPMPGWTGLFAPVAIPPAVLKRLSGDILKALKLPDSTEKINQVGFDVIANTPEQFAAQIKSELALVGKVAKAANIRLD